MSIAKDLALLISQVASLRRFVERGRPKPHKAILLLTVVDLFEQGVLTENRIDFGSGLIAQFRANFRRYSQEGDLCQPTIPFFHLRGSGFWHHQIKEGRGDAYSRIKKMGANSAWITDNIEFAYLSDSAYAVISSPLHRNILKEYLIALLFEETRDMRKVGTAFHETMKLRRANLSQALACMSEGVLDYDTIYQRTSLGSNEAKTAPSYLRACGLIDWEKQLTHFGELVFSQDRFLSRLATVWLIHYHLSAPHCIAPGFWGRLVNRYLIPPGEELSVDSLVEDVSVYVAEVEQKIPNAATNRSTANIFLKAYSEEDGLGMLGILREEAPQKYIVGTPAEIPWRVMAYILADFWEANWGQTLSVPFAQINEEGGPTALMLLNSGQMGQLLKPMQEAGLVEVSRVTRPWTVIRKWSSKDDLLEAVYADNAA